MALDGDPISAIPKSRKPEKLRIFPTPAVATARAAPAPALDPATGPPRGPRPPLLPGRGAVRAASTPAPSRSGPHPALSPNDARTPGAGATPSSVSGPPRVSPAATRRPASAPGTAHRGRRGEPAAGAAAPPVPPGASPRRPPAPGPARAHLVPDTAVPPAGPRCLPASSRAAARSALPPPRSPCPRSPADRPPQRLDFLSPPHLSPRRPSPADTHHQSPWAGSAARSGPCSDRRCLCLHPLGSVPRLAYPPLRGLLGDS